LTDTQKDWIFVSDTHFTGREPEEMETFLGFLNSEKERMSHLVILGDLFEFFFGFKETSSIRGVFPFIDYLPILEGLQRLYRQGIRIKYFEGNHDFFINSFFSEQFGMEVEVYPEGGEENLEGRRVFLAHGDSSNSGQWTNSFFRCLLKNRWAFGLIQFAGPGLSRRVARALSERSYQKYHTVRPSTPPPGFKTFAHQKFLEGFDIVILAHSHFPEKAEESIHGRKCLYFNVGDWMTHRSYLRFTPPEGFKLERYNGGDIGTRGHGDAETRRNGDREIGR
jgi:UDP-2,3-diacylglucosamine hydrolase